MTSRFDLVILKGGFPSDCFVLSPSEVLESDSQFCVTDKSIDWKCDSFVEPEEKGMCAEQCEELTNGKADLMYPVLPVDLPRTCETCVQDPRNLKWCVTGKFIYSLRCR